MIKLDIMGNSILNSIKTLTQYFERKNSENLSNSMDETELKVSKKFSKYAKLLREDKYVFKSIYEDDLADLLEIMVDCGMEIIDRGESFLIVIDISVDYEELLCKFSNSSYEFVKFYSNIIKNWQDISIYDDIIRYLCIVYVDPNERRQGVASSLIYDYMVLKNIEYMGLISPNCQIFEFSKNIKNLESKVLSYFHYKHHYGISINDHFHNILIMQKKFANQFNIDLSCNDLNS